VARSADRVAAVRVGVSVEPMDEQFVHIALPKLYGAPAYARPPIQVIQTPRPLNPDDLPIVALMSDEDMEILALVPEMGDRVPATPAGGVATLAPDIEPRRSRAFSLRGVADRIRGPRS
jgi:hypothetical protein